MEKEKSDIRADLERIEQKLDEILFRLGKGRPRSIAEIQRLADAKFLELQNRKARKEERKKEAERQGKKE
jgi:hypothetical protein